MDLLLQILTSASSLASFVCFVIVAVKMFQKKQAVLGVVSILSLPCLIGFIIALFVGWKNRTAWNLEKVMPIFIVTFCLTLVASSFLVADTWKQGKKELEQPNSEFESELEVPQISSQ